MIPARVKSSWGVKAEAVQVVPESADAIAAWVGGEVVNIDTHVNGTRYAFHAIKIPGEDTTKWARVGDFIVRWPASYSHFAVYPTRVFSELFTYE